MATISGTVRDENGDLISEGIVRAYRRDTGELLVSGLTGDGSEEIPGDTYYDNVSLLLHCEGTDGSTTFTDSGPNPKTVTAAGNAHIETDQFKYGSASGQLDGSGDYLNCGDHADFEFGSGDFTLEAWIRFSGYSSSFGGFYAGVIIGKDAVGARAFHWKIIGTSSSWTTIVFSTAGTEVSASYTFSLNTWYHLAVCKSGTTLRFFVDGTQAGTNQTHNSTISNVATALTVGSILYTNVEYYFPGFLDEVRITKGVARYTENFTAPTAAFLEGTTPAKPIGEYSLTTAYTDEVQVIALDPAGGTTFNDLILRTTPV